MSTPKSTIKDTTLIPINPKLLPFSGALQKKRFYLHVSRDSLNEIIRFPPGPLVRPQDLVEVR